MYIYMYIYITWGSLISVVFDIEKWDYVIVVSLYLKLRYNFCFFFRGYLWQAIWG